MNKKRTYTATILSIIVLVTCLRASQTNSNRPDLAEAMKDSVVYIEISTQGYRQSEPWKKRNLSSSWASACAVGEYEVITTADRVANLAFMKALRYGQNEFVSAKLTVVDYQTNLCLIQLDPNELSEPLKPLTFNEDFQKGAEVGCCWLSSDNTLYTARAYLDRVSVQQTRTSHEQYLRYVVASASQRTNAGEVYCVGLEPIGIACWSNNDNEAGLIPAEIINRFLDAVSDENYEGFGNVGFEVSELLDPAMRSFLKMPETLKSGVYVADVYNLGTGSGVLKEGDVILSIDGNILDPYGRFLHPKYDRMLFDPLITGRCVGEIVRFELWRDAEKIDIITAVKGFQASEMLVPYHEFDQQPEYIITAGFLFQKLTREYLREFGSDIAGDAPSHLYYYYRYFTFKPTEERRDIVVLSYVLPMQYNLGYAGLGQIVVSTFNGMKIRSIKDILEAQKLNPDSKNDVIEFELGAPTVAISREQIPIADTFVRENYGITELFNINQ